jgi:hypothetical protein
MRAGYFVKAPVELHLGQPPLGQQLVGADLYIAFKEWCKMLNKANNVLCVFGRMTGQAYEVALGAVFGLELIDIFRYFGCIGYDGSVRFWASM